MGLPGGPVCHPFNPLFGLGSFLILKVPFNELLSVVTHGTKSCNKKTARKSFFIFFEIL
jgi:hypothetical protein